MKVFCHERHCGWKGLEEDVLIAEHPFGHEGAIIGCPKCKDVGTLDYACDEPDCWEFASCGTPTLDGYKHTCGKHRPIR